MANSDDTPESRFLKVDVIDARDSTEIWISRATLELKLRDLESAGASARYEDTIPLAVSALTSAVSSISLYISSSQGGLYIFLTILLAIIAVIFATLGVQTWVRAYRDRDKRKVTAESVLADIRRTDRNRDT